MATLSTLTAPVAPFRLALSCRKTPTQDGAAAQKLLVSLAALADIHTLLIWDSKLPNFFRLVVSLNQRRTH
jgi:hypothetical protein